MSDNKFYVGQRVRIREVDDLISEWGLHRYCTNWIACPDMPFHIGVGGMRKFCGATAKIIRIEDDSLLTLDSWLDNSGRAIEDLEWAEWVWTVSMVEPVDDVVDIEFNPNNFASMLGIGGEVN